MRHLLQSKNRFKRFFDRSSPFRARLICAVSRGQESKRPGPFASSRHNEIQFEFRDGGCNDVI